MDRRYFFKALASGLVAAAAPELFLPKLIKPAWKVVDEVWPTKVEHIRINAYGGSVEDLHMFLGILEEFQIARPLCKFMVPEPGSKVFWCTLTINELRCCARGSKQKTLRA